MRSSAEYSRNGTSQVCEVGPNRKHPTTLGPKTHT